MEGEMERERERWRDVEGNMRREQWRERTRGDEGKGRWR